MAKEKISIVFFALIWGVQPDPELDPPAQIVWFGPRTDRPDIDDRSAVGLCSLNSKTAGRLAGSRLRNQYLTDPTVSDRKLLIFYPICWDLTWTRRKITHFLFDMPRPHWDPARSCRDRLDLLEIRRDLIKIRSSLARFGGFWRNSVDFRTTRNWLRTDMNPVKIHHPNRLHSPVDSGSWSDWVGSGLSTNPTRADTWTALALTHTNYLSQMWQHFTLFFIFYFSSPCTALSLGYLLSLSDLLLAALSIHLCVPNFSTTRMPFI